MRPLGQLEPLEIPFPHVHYMTKPLELDRSLSSPKMRQQMRILLDATDFHNLIARQLE